MKTKIKQNPIDLIIITLLIPIMKTNNSTTLLNSEESTPDCHYYIVKYNQYLTSRVFCFLTSIFLLVLNLMIVFTLLFTFK